MLDKVRIEGPDPTTVGYPTVCFPEVMREEFEYVILRDHCEKGIPLEEIIYHSQWGGAVYFLDLATNRMLLAAAEAQTKARVKAALSIARKDYHMNAHERARFVHDTIPSARFFPPSVKDDRYAFEAWIALYGQRGCYA